MRPHKTADTDSSTSLQNQNPSAMAENKTPKHVDKNKTPRELDKNIATAQEVEKNKTQVVEKDAEECVSVMDAESEPPGPANEKQTPSPPETDADPSEMDQESLKSPTQSPNRVTKVRYGKVKELRLPKPIHVSKMDGKWFSYALLIKMHIFLFCKKIQISLILRKNAKFSQKIHNGQYLSSCYTCILVVKNFSYFHNFFIFHEYDFEFYFSANFKIHIHEI